jgi:hypothetical protein
MAAYAAISATSQAVLGLLQSAAVGSEFSGSAFAHYHVKHLEQPMAEGVSLHLYRMTIGAGRNQPPRLGLDGIRYKPPLPVDLHYLLTAWAGDPIKQQRLLGWAVRVLEDTPILPAGVLNQHAPEPDVFRSEESVELVWESLSLADWFSLWDGLRTKQPSATYVARMVMLDSDVPLGEYPDVQAREFGMAAVGT